ncbi:LysR family transcriptional regulator [Amycolatopsis taiwanensis]|uniref:LysR family transcriptional regulator n=1 Tax=Amycolatopsis taiwanensis TaxID=342230 RepID=UPI0004B7CE48|nr:LysR family transcriptional regulator [Amycolatopsis taiwanensis]
MRSAITRKVPNLVSTAGPFKPQATKSLSRLRTLLAVHETGTALGAARMLGREQSSVQKQLDTLNRNFGELCGEPLVHKRGRGMTVLFTDTGEALVHTARNTLGTWLDEIHERRRRLGGTLTVGTTRYTLGYLSEASERVRTEFANRGIDLKVVHVRTHELLDKLASGQVDLVCGSVVTTTGADSALSGLDVLEWRRSDLSLVTNLPHDQLPGPVAGTELAALPLVMPVGGLITEFVRRWFGNDYRNRLDIVAEIDSAQYGFELLHYGLVRGCMLVVEGIGEAVAEGRMPSTSSLRTVKLISDLQPGLRILAGAFARRGERASYAGDHPLNLLWQALTERHEAYQRQNSRTTARS